MITPELSTICFGLFSAVTWGAGDFFGGLATKRSHVYMVVIVSQLVGLTLLITMALILAEPLPAQDDWIWGMAAGVSGSLGLVALYRGLAGGRMGIVAPLAALTTATVPVLFGLFLEGLPTGIQMTGFIMAFVAVWIISRSGEGSKVRMQEIGLPLLSGFGFGLFLLSISKISSDSTLWALAAARATSIPMLTIMALLSGHRKTPTRNQFMLFALVGIFEAAGNALFALATQFGRLDVAAVLASLYPVSTVLLARLILSERLSRQQWLGIALALVAVVLIAA